MQPSGTAGWLLEQAWLEIRPIRLIAIFESKQRIIEIHCDKTFIKFFRDFPVFLIW